MTDAVRLLACPFCGGLPSMEFSRYDLDEGFHVICHGEKDCPLYCSDPYRVWDDKEIAAEVWNRRASPTPSASEAVAWRYEEQIIYSDGEPGGWNVRFTTSGPTIHRDGPVRNITPLYASQPSSEAGVVVDRGELVGLIDYLENQVPEQQTEDGREALRGWVAILSLLGGQGAHSSPQERASIPSRTEATNVADIRRAE